MIKERRRSMGIDKEWEVHHLNNIDLKGEDDVTNSTNTFIHIFIIIWATLLTISLHNRPFIMLLFYSISLIFLITLIYTITDTNTIRPFKYCIQLIKKRYLNKKIGLHALFIRCKKCLITSLKESNFLKELQQIDALTSFSFWTLTLIAVAIPFIRINNVIYLFALTIISILSFIKLLNNKNFILYDILYKYRLKIKLITIKEDLSPFSPLLTQFERILLGLNSKNLSKKRIDFRNSIVYFWIRKDKEKNRERSLQQLIPFISLITILFVLKEKSYRFVAIIGAYFSFIGILFIINFTYFIHQFSAICTSDKATITIITILSLTLWYLMTIYNIYRLLDINRYLQKINDVSRRAKIKSNFNFDKGYQSFLEIFDRDNAIYIYDYIVDKYQYVDSKFLLKNLALSKRLIEKNIGTLITIIISMVLVVMVEITANGVF